MSGWLLMKLRGRLVRRWLGILASHWSRRSRREVSLRHRGLTRRSGRALLKLRGLSARGRSLWGRCCTALRIEILAFQKKVTKLKVLKGITNLCRLRCRLGPLNFASSSCFLNFDLFHMKLLAFGDQLNFWVKIRVSKNIFKS